MREPTRISLSSRSCGVTFLPWRLKNGPPPMSWPWAGAIVTRGVTATLT